MKIMQNNWFHRVSIIEFPGVIVWRSTALEAYRRRHPRGCGECNRASHRLSIRTTNTTRLSSSASQKWHRRRAPPHIVSVRFKAIAIACAGQLLLYVRVHAINDELACRL